MMVRVELAQGGFLGFFLEKYQVFEDFCKNTKFLDLL